MWKTLRNIISGIKQVAKYGGLAVVLISILVFAAEALDKWQKENVPEGEK